MSLLFAFAISVVVTIVLFALSVYGMIFNSSDFTTNVYLGLSTIFFGIVTTYILIVMAFNDLGQIVGMIMKEIKKQ